jgi:NHS family xanthosine MFS transporter
VLGSSISGLVIDAYFTRPDHSLDWHGIWLSFAGYALVVAVLFVFLFKHKHVPERLQGTAQDGLRRAH